jgi:hypothetical protein
LVNSETSEQNSRPKKVFSPPEINANEICHIQYVVKYREHAYINLMAEALGDRDLKTLQFHFEEEFFPSKNLFNL